MNVKIIWILLTCLIVSLNNYNAGLLISIPIPLTPPSIQLDLPSSINPLIIDKLELTNVQIQSVDYTWNFFVSYGAIKISKAIFSFNWRYKQAHTGVGQLIDANLEINSTYNFTKSVYNRLNLLILNSVLRIGKTYVKLYGDSSLTPLLITTITQIILNRASVFFRKSLQNVINNQLISVCASIGKDRSLFCWSQGNCMLISMLLVDDPFISTSSGKKQLIIKANGAIYLSGQKSQYLNPPEVLPTSYSSNITVEVHPKVLKNAVDAYFDNEGYNFTLNISDFTDLVDINSQSLSSLFPQMKKYSLYRNILSNITLKTIDILQKNDSQFFWKIDATIYINTQTRSRDFTGQQSYLKPINISVQSVTQIVYGLQLVSLRINSVVFDTIYFDKDDVQTGKVVPQMINKYLIILGSWVKSSINGNLNTKVKNVEFAGLKVKLNGVSLQNCYLFDIQLEK